MPALRSPLLLLSLLPELLLLLLLALQPRPAISKCANDCNNNGFCRANGTSNSVCECDSFSTDNRFTAVDCSFKACPTGKAWVDYASANDVAHAEGTMCSNKGSCQRDAGVCSCESGWTGLACERLRCPGNPDKNGTVCSGHGMCLSMGQMAEASRYKDGVRLVQPVTTYTQWDHDMIFGCVCEPGFSGYDCATRACPTGDDPLTAGVDTVQILECTCLTTCSGGFHLTFRGEESALIPHDATLARLKHTLEAMKTIRGVSLALHGGGTSVCSNGGVSTAITFTHNPGTLPALVPSFANTLLSTTATAPTMSVVTAGAGAQGGTAVAGTREDVECSNRGTCDLEAAYCTCQTGFSSSDGAGAAGTTGDCSYMPSAVSTCPLYSGTACGGAGRGTCSGASAYTCTCATGYEGPACEFKSCPTGQAWFDEPTAANTAHAAGAVCSNRGACDRSSGSCKCGEGFEGSACETMSCPGSTPCSGTGKGTCYTIAELATLGLDNGQLIGATYSSSLWDSAKIKGCHCKETHDGPFPNLEKYGGYDCSLRNCPTGDDPGTLLGVHEIQTITCYATSGYFLLSFRDRTTVTDQILDWPGIGIADTAADVRTAVLTMIQQATGAPPYAYAPNDVEVTMVKVSDGTTSTTACSATGVKINVKFLTDLGDVPMMLLVEPSGTTSGSGSGAVYAPAGSITITETQVGTMENVECGNQGICEQKKGVCVCMPGFDSSDGNGGPGLRGDCGYALPYPNVYSFEGSQTTLKAASSS